VNNKIIQNAALIQLNAEAIQMNAKTILMQAEDIKLRATKEEVEQQGDQQNKKINAVSIDLSAANAQIRLKADQTVTDALGQRVSAAEIAIDGANSKITLKADKIDLDALITKVNGLTTGGVKAKSLYTEKLIVTNNYVHIGEKDGSWKTYTAVTDFTQASGESAPSADATVFAAAIGEGVTRTPEAGETIAFGGAA